MITRKPYPYKDHLKIIDNRKPPKEGVKVVESARRKKYLELIAVQLLNLFQIRFPKNTLPFHGYRLCSGTYR